MNSDKDCLRQLDNLLGLSDQSWLFGAGISFPANIPLMDGLTIRIFNKAGEHSDGQVADVLGVIKSELPDGSHIEHILSHLRDIAAIAERSKTKQAQLGHLSIGVGELKKVHALLLGWIAETIRWGYVQPENGTPEQIGNRDNPLVRIDQHREFILALFKQNQAGVAERRRAVRLFTINYDTLLEDALALGRIPYWDGFLGGALAFRNHRFGQSEPESGYRAHLIKLHGSIDWHLGPDERVWRVRDGDLYPQRSTRVVIYPQSTKYFATQRDPFSAQFDIFRRTLNSGNENVLAICGYSFGDEHINQEIEIALQRPDNKTTTLVFCQELNDVLKRWQKMNWAKRLYIITEAGIFIGTEGPHFQPDEGLKHEWWKFSGVTQILNSGAEAFVA